MEKKKSRQRMTLPPLTYSIFFPLVPTSDFLIFFVAIFLPFSSKKKKNSQPTYISQGNFLNFFPK
jgi:hypothetical protein